MGGGTQANPGELLGWRNGNQEPRGVVVAGDKETRVCTAK